MAAAKKVLIIGLDCAEPSLVFDAWAQDLPNIARLIGGGLCGNLTSCLPPVTVPAWSCMAASKDPGTLGIYGFQNREDHSYEGLAIATSLAVKQPRLWDILGQARMESIVIGVPGTFPIWRPVHGHMVTGFLTPGTDCDYTHPPELKQEIADLVGEYIIDCHDFRTDDKHALLAQIYDMTDKRFKVAEHLLRTKPWHLAFLVEMGPDRVHHGFWRFLDPSHRLHQPHSPFASAIHDYYVHLDELIGRLLGAVDLSQTAVWIVSDHGAKSLIGGVCFNDWLIRQGYLALKETPAGGPVRFAADLVDWPRTRVWGEGGYYARAYVNLKGREPQGIVDPADYEPLRDELICKLQNLPDHQEHLMNTRAYKPQDLYRYVHGVAPDLIVVFGDLHWRSVGSLGHPDIYTFDSDTGPDDANHSQQGLYVLAHPSLAARRRRQDATIYDVAPTTLHLLGLTPPDDMIGQSLL